MSRSNKRIKRKMIQIYGEECFIDKLQLRKDKQDYTGKAQYKKMKQLTYHHIVPKSKGGKATIQNGALLSFENHIWFNKQSKKRQKAINNKFQEYKAGFKIGIAEVTTEGISQLTEYIPEIEEPIYIPVYDFTEEQYQAHLQKRRELELQKPKWKGGER